MLSSVEKKISTLLSPVSKVAQEEETKHNTSPVESKENEASSKD